MSCSFCGLYTHNIRNCRNPMIDIYYERIKVIFMNVTEQRSYSLAESIFSVIVSREFKLRELKAVCAKYTYYSLSRLKTQIIHLLYEHFIYNIIEILDAEENRLEILGAEDNGEWLEVRRLPQQPDPIPDFARDLEEPSSPIPEEEHEYHDILWYIDRTPDMVGAFAFDGLNLNAAFEAVSHPNQPIQQIKKYNIVPLLFEKDIEKDEVLEECAICYENIKCADLVKLGCHHKFCGSCIKGSLDTNNKIFIGNIYHQPNCALCRTQMTMFTFKNHEIYNLLSNHLIHHL